MDQLQRNHVHDLKKLICELLESKYEVGAREHGGYIWDLSLLALVDAAISEVIDLGVYLLTLREKLTTSQPTVVNQVLDRT